MSSYGRLAGKKAAFKKQTEQLFEHTDKMMKSVTESFFNNNNDKKCL